MINEHQQNKAKSSILPRWIFYFGCLLVFIGGVSGLLGIFSPTTFFNDFPSVSNWADISYVTTGWGIRNLSMCAAMILALWVRSPTAIGIVFSMRFITEAGDLINTLATGHGSMDQSLIVVAAIWVVVILIPEALAARWGITRMSSEHQHHKKL